MIGPLRLAIRLAMPLLVLLIAGCGSSGSATSTLPATSPTTLTVVSTPTPAPTQASASPTAPAVTTPPPGITTVSGPTPTSSAGGCPSGWSQQNVPARSYHVCLPPGWTATLLSAASSPATPTPSTASLASEPVGSLVLVFSPEQAGHTDPGSVNNGTLIRIFMTMPQVSFALPKFPICSGAAGSVASRITSICNLDNTSDPGTPYRLQEWFSMPANPTISVQAFTGKDVTTAGQQLAVQVVGTIRFN